MNNEKICMFTGHRNIDVDIQPILTRSLGALIERLAYEGFVHFRAGGAIGFDTIAALKVIETKKKLPHIRLHMYLPCKSQDAKWGETARAAYRFILSNADSIEYVSETYTCGCMQKRNRRMVDGSDLCVTYCITDYNLQPRQLSLFESSDDIVYSQRGGTQSTLKYAQSKGVPIIRIDDDGNIIK